MRRHDARKWLHAILDLLPVILIPVFMIYSHRHTIDSYTVDVPQNKIVNFNQIIKNGDFEDVSPFNWATSNGASMSYNDNVLTLTTGSLQYGRVQQYFNYQATNKILIKVDLKNVNVSDVSTINYGAYGIDNVVETLEPTLTYSWLTFSKICYSNTSSSSNRFMVTNSTTNSDESVEIANFQCFDLTQMFGAGNEPTIQEFNQWYTSAYYNYTLSHKELLKGYSTINYDDTDIMSQFTYNLYNSVDKYFNMNNVFGLNGVYDWFNLNIFNGNAPLYIYIIWNIVLYEFVMDLLMLLYALFMWFIDFCQDLIDRCFTTSKGGKH